MKKRYKRLIYTFEHSVEVYEYLDGKYGAPGTKRGRREKPHWKRSDSGISGIEKEKQGIS